MDLSVITVTHNSKDTITEQIRSVILAGRGLEYEQIIVDNASTDGTADIIEREFKDVRIIRNSNNRGFAKANNQGEEVSSGEFILFLNPDMKFVNGGEIKVWIDWMKAHLDVGVSGCKLLTPPSPSPHRGGINIEINLSATPRRFPKLWEMLVVVFKLPHLFPHLLDWYLYRDRNFNQEQEVDSVRGSCVLVHRELAVRLGFAFDPRYFIWFEDVDLCREAKRLGYKVMYTPIVSCVDFVGQSFNKKNFWWKQKQFVKSMVKYFWKWRM